eukprot:Sspe_Gene.3403::Locus_1118_Transcript_2_2_Confidence_0.600_Length_504::g.3403::m.3403
MSRMVLQAVVGLLLLGGALADRVCGVGCHCTVFPAACPYGTPCKAPAYAFNQGICPRMELLCDGTYYCNVNGPYGGVWGAATKSDGSGSLPSWGWGLVGGGVGFAAGAVLAVVVVLKYRSRRAANDTTEGQGVEYREMNL